MRVRACWVVAVLMLTTQCASIPKPVPSPTRPVNACYISCASGYVFRQQHICRGDRRRFLDVRLIGEHVRRGVDGTVITAVWTACTGQLKPDGSCYEETDFDKRDIIFMRCDEFRRQHCQRMDVDCGHHPGEPDPH